MIGKPQLNRVQLTNQHPLNRVAATFLPDKTASATELAILSLMRWGLDNGITIKPLGAGDPDTDRVRTQIDAMTAWEPRRAMMFLLHPEEGEDSVALEADDLAAEADAEDAAGLLLENLVNAMVAAMP